MDRTLTLDMLDSSPMTQFGRWFSEAAAAGLPGPEHAAPVYDEDPSKQEKWRHWVHRLTGRSDWHHET